MPHILSQRSIQQILKLQQLFHSRYLTVQLLNQLISSYVQLIESFDGQHSPIRKYFLTKIQFVVSRPEINLMLQRSNQQPVMDLIRQTVRCTNMNQIETQQMLMEVIQADNKKNKQMNKNKNLSSSNQKNNKHVSRDKQQKIISSKSSKQEQKNQNISSNMTSPQQQQQKFKDRHLKIQMQMKVMLQIQQNMKKIQNQFQNQSQKNTKTNKRINKLMQQQQNSLQNRLAMRRKKKKKSIDQKQIKQRQQFMPIIKKQQLKQAQKQIQQAVIRMTIRMTQRASQQNRGVTGLLGNVPNNTVNMMKKQQQTGIFEVQKQKGRIKIKNQVKQQNQDEQDLNLISNKPKIQQKQKRQQTSNTRLTNLASGGGKGRITVRKNQKDLEDDVEM